VAAPPRLRPLLAARWSWASWMGGWSGRRVAGAARASSRHQPGDHTPQPRCQAAQQGSPEDRQQRSRRSDRHWDSPPTTKWLTFTGKQAPATAQDVATGTEPAHVRASLGVQIGHSSLIPGLPRSGVCVPGCCQRGRCGALSEASGLLVGQGHEVAVGSAGGVEFVGSFLELLAQVEEVLFEFRDPGP
jgi:hypothetical protein